MTLQEAIEFLEDMQLDACENCSLKETCDNAGTGVCVEALGVIKKRIVELERLRAENAKLRELVGLAVEDIISLNERPCELCKFKNATWIIPKPCENCDSPERVGSNWQWQHANKLKEIDGKDGV